MTKTKINKQNNVEEISIEDIDNCISTLDSPSNRKRYHSKIFENSKKKKYYTLDQDLFIIKINMRIEAQQFFKESLDDMIKKLSIDLNRSVKSIQRRREKLQRLNKAQKSQIFKYVQMFPKLAHKRKLLILRNNSIVYQTIEGKEVDKNELKKVKQKLHSNNLVDMIKEIELKNLNKNIPLRKKKIKKGFQNIEQFNEYQQKEKQKLKDQKKKIENQNKKDRKLIRSFMNLYLQFFEQFPDKIIIDFQKQEINHQFGTQQFTNYNKSFFDVINELKCSKEKMQHKEDNLSQVKQENNQKDDIDQSTKKEYQNEQVIEDKSFKSYNQPEDLITQSKNLKIKKSQIKKNKEESSIQTLNKDKDLSLGFSNYSIFNSDEFSSIQIIQFQLYSYYIQLRQHQLKDLNPYYQQINNYSMRVQTIVEGNLIDMEDDQEITIDAEMDDSIEDIIVKASLSFSNLDINKASLVYEGRTWEKTLRFFQIRYDIKSYIYIKGKKEACSNCLIF